VTALALALGASVAWGASDFLGGLASRRMPLLVVLFGAQTAGLVLALAAWALAGATLPSSGAAGAAGLAGLAELAGFACLYRGLAAGAMGMVAPLAALAAVLPVAAALAGGQSLSAPVATGAGLALAGSAACAVEPGTGVWRPARGALLGIGAAACFGVFFVGLGDAAATAGPGAVLCGRVASVVVLAALLAVRGTPAAAVRADMGRLAALGALDVAANLGYAAACEGGLRGGVAVLGSLYPLTTVLLARAVLRERLGAARRAGAAAVIAGVALISAAG